ncbi:MAG: PAS domain S-box protein, partial [Euryarchaeota archaeon]|nr:PAS domain S-box protein [Euryarchaeota archaeon]
MISLLIVDDEPDLLELTKIYLENTGDFTVDTAASAREALEVMETTTYDAIVSDYQMPEMDGIEFLKTVRGTGSDIPFIIFTRKGREDVVIEALNAGADLYLRKGGHPKAQFAELTGMIKHAVERNQAKEELNTAYKHMQAAFEKAKASEEALTLQNKRLEKSEERYRNVVEGQTELISHFLPNGTHVFVNEAYCHYFGKRLEEIMGHRFIPAIPSEDQELVKNHFAVLTPDHPVDTIEHRIIMPDGEVRWQSWSDRAIFDEKGTVIEYQSVGRDITDLKIAEAVARQKLKIEETLAAVTSRFTGIFDFDDAVNGTLADIGRLSRADRAYLFLLREGGRVLDNTHEWCVKGVNPQIDTLQNIPPEMFPWWMKKIRNREIIHIADVSNLPPEAEAEREMLEMLEMQEIRSLIVLPIFCREKPAGFMGFDNVRETGEWTEEDIFILRTIAEIVGKSLELKRMQGALRASEEKFHDFFRTSQDAVFITSKEGKLLNLNESLVELFGYDSRE